MSYLDILKQVGPETVLTLAALAVLAVDLMAMRDKPPGARLRVAASVAGLGCMVAAGWLLLAPSGASGVPGMFVNDALTCVAKLAVLALALCAAIFAVGTNFTRHVGEFVSLILMAAVGMLLLVSSANLLMIFVALELTSLSLYVLAAFNKRDIKSAEAALKYFLFGGMSAAFTLFGISLIYGLTGSLDLLEIARALAAGSKPEALLLVALVMTLIGFAFKVAAAPFHLWAPDAYQGAPVPSAVLIASGSKVASFFVLARLLLQGLAGAAGSAAWHQFIPGWAPVIAVLVATSMIFGNFAAIAQTDVKRLLAYSAVAHAGYALLGVLAADRTGVSALVYYTATYGFTVAGAFGVTLVVEQMTGGSRLTDFAGLGKREPVISFCMMVFMLSLAGIPPLAGFFGKFYLFTAVAGGAPDLGLIGLVFLAVAMSAVSLYYYLQVLKQIYVAVPPEGATNLPAPAASSRMLVSLLALAVVLLGCWPGLLVTPLVAALKTAGFGMN